MNLPNERRVQWTGAFWRIREVTVARDELVTATEASLLLPISVQLISMWRSSGKVTPVRMRGRSPLYRYADLEAVERDMREAAAAANNHRARRPLAA